ncbi:putative ubiquitin thiolesterase protein, putative peptidase C19, partial [Pseudoloma neurophilia]
SPTCSCLCVKEEKLTKVKNRITQLRGEFIAHESLCDVFKEISEQRRTDQAVVASTSNVGMNKNVVTVMVHQEFEPIEDVNGRNADTSTNITVSEQTTHFSGLEIESEQQACSSNEMSLDSKTQEITILSSATKSECNTQDNAVFAREVSNQTAESNGSDLFVLGIDFQEINKIFAEMPDYDISSDSESDNEQPVDENTPTDKSKNRVDPSREVPSPIEPLNSNSSIENDDDNEYNHVSFSLAENIPFLYTDQQYSLTLSEEERFKLFMKRPIRFYVDFMDSIDPSEKYYYIQHQIKRKYSLYSKYFSKEQIPIELSRPLLPLESPNNLNSIVQCLFVCKSVREYIFLNTTKEDDIFSFLTMAFDYMENPQTKVFLKSGSVYYQEQYTLNFEKLNNIIYNKYKFITHEDLEKDFLPVFCSLIINDKKWHMPPIIIQTLEYNICMKCKRHCEVKDTKMLVQTILWFKLIDQQNLQQQIEEHFLPHNVYNTLNDPCKETTCDFEIRRLVVAPPKLLILKVTEKNLSLILKMDKNPKIIDITESLVLQGRNYELKAIALKHYTFGLNVYTAIVKERCIWYFQNDTMRKKIKNIKKYLQGNSEIFYLLYECIGY